MTHSNDQRCDLLMEHLALGSIPDTQKKKEEGRNEGANEQMNEQTNK